MQMTKEEEKELINDILMYLPEWQVIPNDKPQQKPIPQQDKIPQYAPRQKHPTQHTKQILNHHSPQDHKHPVDPFIHEKDIKHVQHRKTITENELLQNYRVAYNQILAYTNRTRLPINPIIHEALCMWTAGLLEKKYKFKQITGNDEHYYTLHLIKDAQKILEPYIKSYFKVLKISDCHDKTIYPSGRL